MAITGLEETADYATQAREFLDLGREFLASGDLHQASERAGARRRT